MQKIGIIGGGASGMMAAIAAKQAGGDVTILEHKDRIGKKILSTGNGRCNFTNTMQEPQCYHTDNPDPFFPWEIIRQFTAQDTIAFFLQLGIYSKNKNGYLYPQSEQASAVLDVLRMEINRLDIPVLLEEQISEIKVTKGGFRVQGSSRSFSFDKVIVAAGSKAAPATGSDGSGYTLAKMLGHHMVPVLPSLVQLRCKEPFYKNLAGIRVYGKVGIYTGNECVAADTGEIQLTNYGISGIPVFQVSRYAAKGLYRKQEVFALLDFMPDFTPAQTKHFLKKRMEFRPQKKLHEFFIGLLNKKLSDTMISLSGIDKNKAVAKLTDDEWDILTAHFKEFKTVITATNSFEHAQVCSGGIKTEELDPETLESRLVPGLFFAGEIIDVDGLCGGYNLQWAWSSGYVAGKEAAK